MRTDDIRKMGHAYLQVLQNAQLNEKKLDPVDKKAVKKDFDDRKDKDIDNDGNVDDTDKYLHKRRKAVTKAVKKDDKRADDEVSVEESYQDVRLKYINKLSELGNEIAAAAKTLQKQAKDSKFHDVKYVAKEMENLHDLLVSSEYDEPAKESTTLGEAFSEIDQFIEISLQWIEENVDFDQLDELSKKTLSNYVKKASDDMYDKGGRVAYHSNKANKAGGTFAKTIKQKHRQKAADNERKASNRSAGIRRAVNKMTVKESNDRAKHYRSATAPEPIDSKASRGEKNFVAMHGGLKGNDSGIDGVKAAADTARNAVAGMKAAPKRPADRTEGDKKPPQPGTMVTR